jgi:hypothetical protein
LVLVQVFIIACVPSRQHDNSCSNLEERVEALHSSGLAENLDVQANLAEHAYSCNDFKRAYDMSKRFAYTSVER